MGEVFGEEEKRSKNMAGYMENSKLHSMTHKLHLSVGYIDDGTV